MRRLRNYRLGQHRVFGASALHGFVRLRDQAATPTGRHLRAYPSSMPHSPPSRRRIHALYSLLVAAALVGCGSRPLPVDPSWRPDEVCLGVGLDATLLGSPNDPRLTWAVDNATGARLELQWPAGYTALFDPSATVLDELGKVIGRAGDAVIGGCRTGPAANLFLVSSADVSRVDE